MVTAQQTFDLKQKIQKRSSETFISYLFLFNKNHI
jgi:hypothetical protein